MNLKELSKPFPAEDIEWRLQQCGKGEKGIWAMCLAYIDNRAIMNRLDEIVGHENWRNEYVHITGGVMCGLSIKVNNEWITKWDGAENTDVESFKGGISASMKRAAVCWGIGRYLYNLEAKFANVGEKGKYFGKTKDGATFRWTPPDLPEWALPGGNAKPHPNEVQDHNPLEGLVMKVFGSDVDVPSNPNEETFLANLPEDIKNLCRKASMTKGQVKQICKKNNFNLDSIKNDILGIQLGL